MTVLGQRCRMRCSRSRCGWRTSSSLNFSAGRATFAGTFFRSSTPTAICARSTTVSKKAPYMLPISCGTGSPDMAQKVRMKDRAELLPDVSTFDRICGAVVLARVTGVLRSTALPALARRDPPSDAAGACVTVVPRPSAGGPGASVEVHLPMPACQILATVTLAALLERCRAGCSRRESRAAPSQHAPAATAGRERWRICWSARSTRRCFRASGPARPPAAIRAAAGNFQQRPCVRRAWVPRSPRLKCGGFSHRRFA